MSSSVTPGHLCGNLASVAGAPSDYLSANGVPARVVNVPGTAPSYELYGTAHLQRTLQSDG